MYLELMNVVFTDKHAWIYNKNILIIIINIFTDIHVYICIVYQHVAN